ncbi:hypothetical protein O0L34_g4865 [Tuta absoluta]|nr:hypothetical protein O0L34_g4865 [Tuta absoluta]
MSCRLALITYARFKTIRLLSRGYSSKVPSTPVVPVVNQEQTQVKVDKNTIALLERLSLVKFDSEEGVKVLEDSIAFADKILHINTDGIQPLYSVLEDENLSLRPDEITQGNCQKEILKNAAVVDDDYFVAPPGNIPLHEVEIEDKEQSPQKLTKNAKNKVTLEEQGKHFELDLERCSTKEKLDLKFNLIVPKQDTMQYFIQWQRYRKFWWSSITTTPSLFGIGEVNHGETTSYGNIVAKFPWGTETVETLHITSEETIISDTSHLTCTMPLETALLIILLDGLSNSSKTGYLRLHRKMAPYKFSFALNKGTKDVDTLKDLASLLHHRLARKNISTLLPDFSLSQESQLQENLQIGVVYTIVLSDKTLSDGIFHLLNSSTMLTEQVHVADFDSYAGLLFAK